MIDFYHEQLLQIYSYSFIFSSSHFEILAYLNDLSILGIVFFQQPKTRISKNKQKTNKKPI